MPLVISQTGDVQFVPNDEILGEILGHSDFDGEPWAAGDRIIFEDGTESTIVREPGEDFHVWSNPVPADLASVKVAVKVERAGSWRDLFSYFEG